MLGCVTNYVGFAESYIYVLIRNNEILFMEIFN